VGGATAGNGSTNTALGTGASSSGAGATGGTSSSLAAGGATAGSGNTSTAMGTGASSTGTENRASGVPADERSASDRGTNPHRDRSARNERHNDQ
jgi:hypothetical protein